LLWYVFEGETKRGPFAAVDIREMLRAGSVSLDTSVMREGSPIKRRLVELVDQLTAEAAAQSRPRAAPAGPQADSQFDDAAQQKTVVTEAPSFAAASSPRTVVHVPAAAYPRGDPAPARPISPVAAAPAMAVAIPRAPAMVPHVVSVRDDELAQLRAENERLRQERESAMASRPAPPQAAARVVAPVPTVAAATKVPAPAPAPVRSPVRIPVPAPAPAPVPSPVPAPARSPLHAPAMAAGTPAGMTERVRGVREPGSPEHQRPRAASEAHLQDGGAKIRWQDRRLNSTASDGTIATMAAGSPDRSRAVTNHAHGQGVRRHRPPVRAKSSSAFPVFMLVVVGVVLMVGVAFLFSRRMSNLNKNMSQVQEARLMAERVAQSAVERAEAARWQAIADRQRLESRQAVQLRNAEIRARREARAEAKKKSKAAKKLKEAKAARARQTAQDERAAQGAREASREDGRAAKRKDRDAVRKIKKQKSGASRAAAAAATAAKKARDSRARKSKPPARIAAKEAPPVKLAAKPSPPVPGWPSTVLSTRKQLAANGFKVVSVTGVRVSVLPSPGCSPCQTNGNLADGTPVTLVAPTFTPFVPAKMAKSTRVAVKALVQPKPSGEIWLVVQSAIGE